MVFRTSVALFTMVMLVLDTLRFPPTAVVYLIAGLQCTIADNDGVR